jgi:hypothetical protein
MDLPDRIEHLLKREVAWLSETLAWYAQLDRAMDPGTYEDVLERVQEHGKAIDAFTREREILEKELRQTGAATLPPSLKPLANRAAELTGELRAEQDRAATATAKAAQEIHDELGSLQRGRNVMEGYRAGDAQGVQWLDRKG